MDTRTKQLEAALRSPSFLAAADMAAAYRRWNLRRYAAEVRELQERGHAALIAALKGAAK